MTKSERYFSSVGGISTFKRYFNCISHVECSASRFQRRNRHSCSQIVTIYIILTKTVRCFSFIGGISTFKRYFQSILHAECGARRLWLRNKHSSSQIAIISRFWRKLSVISFLLVEFRRLRAILTAFWTPNVVHGVFSFKASTAARNSQPFTRFWRKVNVISLLLVIFRRFNAIFIPFYTPNVVHSVFSFETSTAALKSQSFTRFWRKVDVISLLLVEFRRLRAILTAFYTPNVVHGVFSFETSTAACKPWRFTRFWRKVNVISLLLEIFRSLNAIFIAFYTPNVVHGVFSFKASTAARK